MEDAHAFKRRGIIESADLRAACEIPGIAARRQDDDQGCVVIPLEFDSAQTALRAGEQRLKKVRFEAHQQRLALRVAKPGVELQHLWSVGCDHDAGIKNALVGSIFGFHRLNHGTHDFVHDLLAMLLVQHRSRRIGAHSASVRTFIAVVSRLVILSRRQRHDVFAVGKDKDTRFLTPEQLLDHDLRAGVAVGALDHDVINGGKSFVLIMANDYALAGGEAIRLDHDRRTVPVDEFLGGLRFVEPSIGRAGNAVTRTQVFHEPLGALDDRRPRGRTKHRKPRCLAKIGQTGDQRRLGADNDEIDRMRNSEINDFLQLAGGDGDTLGETCDPGVSGGTVYLSAQGGLGNGPTKCVLASTRSNDQNIHRKLPAQGMSIDPITEMSVNNPPVLTVSALSQALKHYVEKGFGQIRVRGEISGFKQAASGHMYFALKDADAVLDAVCWRISIPRLSIRPCDGMDVVAFGRLTTFPSRSRYQIVIDAIELAGQGALLKLLDDRRKMLAAEGLFDESRKRKLPFLPAVVGIVTSPTGAVIRDILHRFADRFPRRVLLWPVQVQGHGAAEQIAAAIQGFNLLPGGASVPRPDLLIVARGGGSLEDLWAFNEEIVVRAAAASGIPIISAVGHESDTTLIDFATDRRAPTPSAAAEIAVPVRIELLTRIRGSETRLASAFMRVAAERRERVEGLSRGLPKPAHLLDAACQRLDERAERLMLSFVTFLGGLSGAVHREAARLVSPSQRLGRERSRVAAEARLLRSVVDAMLRERSQLLLRVADLLDGCSYQRTLRRGFILAYAKSGRTVSTIDAVAPGDRLNLRFADGEAAVDVKAKSPGAAKARAPSTTRNDQGRLL